MKIKTLYALIIALITLLFAMVATLGALYFQLANNFNQLYTSYNYLSIEHEQLQNLYSRLNSSYYGLRTACEGSAEYGNISVTKALSLIETNPDLIVIDVRLPIEYELNHLQGAVNICTTCQPEQLLENLSPSDEILLYSKSGIISVDAMRFLNQNGYHKVYSIMGGIEAWIASGYPLT